MTMTPRRLTMLVPPGERRTLQSATPQPSGISSAAKSASLLRLVFELALPGDGTNAEQAGDPEVIVEGVRTRLAHR